jgi:hypothetical protein
MYTERIKRQRKREGLAKWRCEGGAMSINNKKHHLL